MPLKKGFLKPKNVINKNRLSTGLILGTAYSFGLYGFFYCFREFFRITTGQYGGVLLELTTEQNFYYNLFYALLASILGFYVFVKFIFENSLSRSNKKLKFKQRLILNDQAYSYWLFQYAILRFGTVIGLWYGMVPFQFEINFLKDYWLLLVLLPITLFLNIWLSILRTAGGQAYKWLAYSVMYISILSFLLATINFSDYKKINKNIRLLNVELAYNIKVPRSEHFQRLPWREKTSSIFIINDSITKKPLIFWNNSNTIIKVNEISNYINIWKDKMSEYERNKLSVSLHVDEEIPLFYVKEINNLLRKKSINGIIYCTALKNSKYPTNYPYFKSYGIPQRFYSFYPELETLLDSIENLDLSKFSLRVPESILYRNRAIDHMNRVIVKVSKDKLFLNETEITKEYLQEFTRKFIEKYSSNGVIIYEPDENIKFKRYIEHLDLLYTVVDKLRNEMSYRLYNEPFNSWDSKDPRDRDKIILVRTKYPRQIIEWTSEEKRLKVLMEKQDRMRINN